MSLDLKIHDPYPHPAFLVSKIEPYMLCVVPLPEMCLLYAQKGVKHPLGEQPLKSTIPLRDVPNCNQTGYLLRKMPP